MKLELNLGMMGGCPELKLEQRLIMPPAAASVEEMADHAETVGVQATDNNNVLTAVNDYISNEPQGLPYSDKHLVQLMVDDGYQVTRRDIATARELLGIPAAKKRYQ